MNKTAILYIAEKCNQQCVFCLEEENEWSEFVDPTTQQVYGVLERLHGKGAQHITFMGGETFFRKDLHKIISRAKSLGYTRVGVTTNGTVLSKAGFIDRLRAAGLDFIELSIHGHDEALAFEISRNKVTYDRQSKAMAEINATKSLFTIVNVVICRENHKNLIDVAKYVLDSLPDVPVRFKFKFVSLQGWALERASEQVEQALDYGEVDFIALGDYLAARDSSFWFYNVPLCYLGAHANRAHELAVLSVDEQYFDLDHRGPNQYYESGHQLEGRVWPHPPCDSCSTRAVCPGLEESYRLANGSAGLRARNDDPEPLVAWALRDRKADPSTAAARLEQLRKLARPATFVRVRPDSALRFSHPEESIPFDVMVDRRVEGKAAFVLTEHWALGYRLRDEADRNPSPRVLALLEHAAKVLQEADAAGKTIDEARAAIVAAVPAPWTCVQDTEVHHPVRKRSSFQLPVLGPQVGASQLVAPGP